MPVVTVGLDLAKTVFQAHGVDAAGETVLRRRLGRSELLAFFAKLPPCSTAMEACSSAHHWAQELVILGHDVRLIPPQYLKPYVKPTKTDAADAEAICEAAGRPSASFQSRPEISRQYSFCIGLVYCWFGNEQHRSTLCGDWLVSLGLSHQKAATACQSCGSA
jgi:transposase